jgi:predicted acyltransferase
VAKQRIISIDIFRGLTMMLMVLVNNPGDWGNIYPPLRHAEWHGWTPTDLVFPFFVFLMGVALPFSQGENRGLTKDIFLKILARSLRLICLGLFLNFFAKIEFGQLQGSALMLFRLMVSGFVGFLLLGDFSAKIKLYIALGLFLLMVSLAYSGIEKYDNVRLPGVLQRLGIVYFFAALIFSGCSFRVQFSLAAVILVGYWLTLAYIPVPGTGEVGFEKGRNFAAWVDQIILKNHVWSSSKTWDPEGVLSTLPAIVSCLIGTWAGLLLKIRAEKKNLVFVGIALLFCGLVWNQYFPINKSLWSSSFVLVSAGLGFILLVIFGFMFDNKKENFVSTFLTTWGVNPIIVFFGAGILPRALNMIRINDQALLSAFYQNTLVSTFSNPLNSSLAYAIINVIFWSGIVLYLKKVNMIIKV